MNAPAAPEIKKYYHQKSRLKMSAITANSLPTANFRSTAIKANRIQSIDLLRGTVMILFGRVPMFYYMVHIFLIHLLAIIGVIVAGYKWSDMVLLTNRVNRVPELKGYGFNLITVYMVWIAVVLLLYPLCKWFDRYKRAHQSRQWWLSYA